MFCSEEKKICGFHFSFSFSLFFFTFLSFLIYNYFSMAPVSAVKPNSLFKYIKREKTKDEFIVISSDEESDDEIPVKTIPTLPVSSGHLNDPISIDLDSDTESMEKYTLSELQNQVAHTHIDSIAVPTPESVLSEPTSLSNVFTAENGVKQYQQDDLVSFGSPMNEDLFHDFEGDSPPQATNLEVPPFITMQGPAVTQGYLDAESSQPASSTLKSLNNSIKSQAPFYGLNATDVPDITTLCVEPRIGHKRVLELAESSKRLEQTLTVNKQDIDMEENDDDEININVSRI
jgi:hypothetical protein